MKSALVVVDMQRYYLEETAVFCRFHEFCAPGCLNYLRTRCREIVIPNICSLVEAFHQAGEEVIYLKLSGVRPDRSDLHPHFRNAYYEGMAAGFEGVYPLQSERDSEVIGEFDVRAGDKVFCKTTYSAFTSSPLEAYLESEKIGHLVFAGLATSQCVETSARDASDRGYRVTHIEDGQADYHFKRHQASLYSSFAVCGGRVIRTEEYLKTSLQVP